MAGKLPILSCLNLATEEPTISLPPRRERKSYCAKQSQFAEAATRAPGTSVRRERTTRRAKQSQFSRGHRAGSRRPGVRNKANLRRAARREPGGCRVKQSQFILRGWWCARQGIRRNALRHHYKQDLSCETKPICRRWPGVDSPACETKPIARKFQVAPPPPGVIPAEGGWATWGLSRCAKQSQFAKGQRAGSRQEGTA